MGAIKGNGKRNEMNSGERKLRVMLISSIPPRNDCGGRVVLHRHLVERAPFDLHVASNADFGDDIFIDTRLELPRLLGKVKKSRFGPALGRWFADYETMIWPQSDFRQLERNVHEFAPDVILTVADNTVSRIAARIARKSKKPLAVFFLDWTPRMKGLFGHKACVPFLDRRFRALYRECDLAFCTSDGMQETLGPHGNGHIVYPMPGRHEVPPRRRPAEGQPFRLTYVGSTENFYGRMHCELIKQMSGRDDLELRIVGPNADWPPEILEEARRSGIYKGFMPPQSAAQEIADADALLVVMSFEAEHELFMRTSFTTKFLDYAAFGKPVILWGPDYCTPSQLALREQGALVVGSPDPGEVVKAMDALRRDPELRGNLASASDSLHRTVFNPERLQDIFVEQIQRLSRRPHH